MADADKEVIRIILQSGNGTEWKVDALDAFMERDRAAARRLRAAGRCYDYPEHPCEDTPKYGREMWCGWCKAAAQHDEET